MSSGRDPWADPATPTEPGAPYLGPPPTQPQPAPLYGWPASGPPPYPTPYGPGPYGAPYGSPSGAGPYGSPWPYGVPWASPVPRPPGRPGQVITSAVLAFVQAALVLIASMYLFFFASIVDLVAADAPPGAFQPGEARALATEGTVLALVQLVSAVLLVTAGTIALNRRRRGSFRLLVAAHAVQVVLAVYWAIRLAALAGDAPGSGGEGVLVGFALFFAAAPVVGLAMVLLGPGRRWFQDPGPATGTG